MIEPEIIQQTVEGSEFSSEEENATKLQTGASSLVKLSHIASNEDTVEDRSSKAIRIEPSGSNVTRALQSSNVDVDGLKVEGETKKRPNKEASCEDEQMRSSCIESQLQQPDTGAEIQSGSCGLLANELAKRLSKDLNCQPIKSCWDKEENLVGSDIEQRELEVEWTKASLFKRVVCGRDSRSICIRTSLAKSLKGKSLQKEAIGRTIKSFVGHFRSSSKDNLRNVRKVQESNTTNSSEDSCLSRLVDLDCDTESEVARHNYKDRNRMRTSFSCQSMLNQQQEAMESKTTTSKAELETTTRNKKEGSNLVDNFSKTANDHVSTNSATTNNITREGYLAKNKYIIEDKLRRQQNTKCGTRFDDRRSTYCSSLGADLNFDSSFSSANNCSESNNTCAMIGQCSRDSNDRNGDDFNECKRPFNNDQCNIIINKAIKPPQYNDYAKRDNWDKNIEFLLSVIGFAVDLGNVWRFPYICYKNGGGAFLIPYTIMFILGGLPIFYLEMSLGQYFSSGCLTVWKRVCPMAKGIGYAMCVLNFFTGLYYNTIISWAVFFMVESFTYDLPWTSCTNIWNSDNCLTISQRQTLRINSTTFDLSHSNQSQQMNYSSPTKDYFEREVLKIHLSSGIDDLGSIRAPLAIYLAIVFVFIYFAIWKGVKSTGKAVWITALLPYFVLIPLLARGVFLEGAWIGIKYYLYPQWRKIMEVDVWVEAAKQIYFSLGPGFGTLMALSSYNKFNHNCCRDTLIAATVNYFASFIAGLVIFAVLGYMATMENVDVSYVAAEGPGLVFQVYPEGLATMQFSSMWSVLFFVMVITLGIDSTFGGLESVITGLCDEYPRVLRAHRSVFIGFLIVLIYICSLPTTTYGGNYVIFVLESYGTSLSLLFIVLIETIIVCWLYGADRFCKNLEEMYGEMPGAYWRICWKYISPTILLIIFIAACGQELEKYHILKDGNYTYPKWAPTVGLLMTGSSICCIPVYAIYYLKTKTSGSFIERLKIACKPIEGDQRVEKEIYVDALTDKIRDENDIHQDTVI